MRRTVTLVTESGTPLGEADLLDAHTGTGKLHRAFSVYVFREDKKQILIQRRSKKKMLWPLVWANTCCSHPFAGEGAEEAGERRLGEELGFTCKLRPFADFVYRAEDPSGKGVEHEYVTILLGSCDAPAVQPNPDEVDAFRWIDVTQLQEDMKQHPDWYAPWFHLGLEKILAQA